MIILAIMIRNRAIKKKRNLPPTSQSWHQNIFYNPSRRFDGLDQLPDYRAHSYSLELVLMQNCLRILHSKCALCLDFYTAPVLIINCGHNFCQECLSEYLPASDDNEAAWNCPECQIEHNQRLEQLSRNFFLERTVLKYIESQKNFCVTHESPKKLRKYKNITNYYSLQLREFPKTVIFRLLQTQSTSLS